MKTDELINLLKEDAPVGLRLPQRLTMLVVAGGLVAILVMLLTIGLRNDLAEKILTWPVGFKVAETLLLATTGIFLAFAAGRPGAGLLSRLKILALPLLMLAAAILAEAVSAPPSEWASRWIGNHPVFCLIFIPMLAVAPMAGLMAALRHGAPDDPGLAGAIAGFASGSMAAAVYAWHCPDDSPFFVASWYMLAILIVTLAGFVLGRRLLRW